MKTMPKDESSMLEWALFYASLGWDIFPLKPKTKTAYYAYPEYTTGNPYSWKEQATHSEERVRRYWTENPDASIGLCTGKRSGNLYVIDLDEVHEEVLESGMDRIRDWESATHFKLDDSTAMDISGRNGNRLYFYADPERFDSRGDSDIFKDRSGVDTRGDGNYVVLPPSIHPNGRRYEWEQDPADYPIKTAGGSFYALWNGTKRDLKNNTQSDTFVQRNDVSTGGRTDYLIKFIASCSIRHPEYSLEELEAEAINENELACTTPLSDEEMRKTVLPYCKKVFKNDTEYRKNNEIQIPTGDIWETKLTDSPPSELIQRTEKLPEIVTLKDAIKIKPVKKPEVIKGVLRKGHVMLLSGPPKAGKSVASAELSVAIAEGMNWFGIPCAKGRVLYVNMEIEGSSFLDRLEEIYKSLGLSVEADTHKDDILIWNMRGMNTDLSQIQESIIQECIKEKITMLILDPLYLIMEGDENSNSDQRKMMSRFNHIATETGAAVMFVHHFAKGYGGDRQQIDRGAGAGTLARAPDAICTITRLNTHSEKAVGWRLESTLREFKDMDPISTWFKYPLHIVDSSLDDVELYTSMAAMQDRKNKAAEEAKAANLGYTDIAVSMCVINGNGAFSFEDFQKNYDKLDSGKSRQTLVRRLQSAGYQRISAQGDKGIWKKIDKNQSENET